MSDRGAPPVPVAEDATAWVRGYRVGVENASESLAITLERELDYFTGEAIPRETILRVVRVLRGTVTPESLLPAHPSQAEPPLPARSHPSDPER